MNQDVLAQLLGFNDRQTVSDIETGKRNVKAEELLKLSDALERDVQFFLDPFSVVAEAEYCWRADPKIPSEKLSSFEEKANSWIGLLRWLRAEHDVQPQLLKPTLPLRMSSTFERAQFFAEEFVHKYNLGPVPAEQLATFVESELGIPVLFVTTGERSDTSSISGAACDLGELSVVMVNRHEPATRRNFNLAHELFHILTWSEMKPEYRESNAIRTEKKPSTARIEQLANSFASALLMPRSSLDLFVVREKKSDIRHLRDVAAKLKVSTEALGWRLLQLGRIDEPTRVALKDQKGFTEGEEAPNPFSTEYVKMLHSALDKGRLSARKAAKTMGMNLGELSNLFTAHKLSPPFVL